MITAILFIAAGIIGLVPQVDTRIAWALILVAGVLMVLPV